MKKIGEIFDIWSNYGLHDIWSLPKSSYTCGVGTPKEVEDN